MKRDLAAWRGNPSYWILVAWLAVVFLLGGSSREDVPFLLTLRPLSALVLVYGLCRLTMPQVKENRWLLGMAAAWVVLHLVQLVPLPPDLWHALPGREIVRDIDRQAALGEPWRPLSMAPDLTWNALWALLAPLATLVLGMQVTPWERRRLLPPVIAMGCISVVLAIVQVLGDPQGPYYYYPIGHNGFAIGLFANRNHQATMLACLIPIIAVWAAARRPVPIGFSFAFAGSRWLPGAIAAAVLVPLILVTESRSGTVLGLIALSALPLLMPRVDHPVGKALPWAALAIPVLVILLFAATIWMGRSSSIDRFFDLDARGDMRVQALPVVLSMIGHYAPWGTGLGAFDPVFRLHEPDALLMPTYMNHAHNDWLELALTGGMPAVALIVLGAVSLILGLARVQRSGSGDFPMVRLGLLLIVLLGLASITDYPLRVPSLACLGALALLLTGARQSAGDKQGVG